METRNFIERYDKTSEITSKKSNGNYDYSDLEKIFEHY
jgi:hypothetical protein